MKTSPIGLCVGALLCAGALTGCHSYRIDATVENRTGAAIELLEVDYPSASFGADTLAAGTDFHYRFQVRLSGPITVQYTDPVTHQQRQMKGPELSQGQQGRIEIILLPGGKAEFKPVLTTGR